MALNSLRFMPRFSWVYCGICLYLANSDSQAGWDIGGTAPVTGFHSVIDRPEPVRRVAPPTTTMASTSTATAKSHTATGRDRSERKKDVIAASSAAPRGQKIGADFLGLSRARVQSRDVVANRCHAWGMPAPSLFSVVVIGLLAGVAARRLVGGRRSLFGSLVAGVLGAMLGTTVAGLFDLPMTGLLAVAMAALAGAAALLSAAELVFRR